MTDIWEKYLPQANLLINRGYPVPTNDPVELAKRIYKSRKVINSSVDRDAPTSIDSSN